MNNSKENSTKNNYMKKILFILLTITMIGCSSNKNDLFETIKYDCKEIDKELNLLFEFNAKIAMPTKAFSKSYKLLQDSIISAVFGSEFINNSHKKILQMYSDSSFIKYQRVYEEIYENNPIEPTDTFTFKTNIVGNILYYDSTIVSYQRLLHTYIDNAHGMTTKTNYVFDIKTGRRLTEEDVFGKGFERKANKSLTEKANVLRSEGKLPKEDNFYNNWNILPNGNFALTDSSVIYTFNPYEIAPYCHGIIDIEIMK